MDEKMRTVQNLADILKIKIPDIQELLNKYPEAKITIKADGSPVTELDIALSQLVEQTMQQHYPHHCFYSEENFNEWKFPLIALDPLDGTREYINGVGEWALSAGLFENEEFKGEGWVYNPVTREIFEKGKDTFQQKTKYRGEVSRSEWEKGLFKKKSSSQFEIHPVGSIAYKLGRLSEGMCDFVVSLRPKCIWDIAGGSLLCQEAGMKFYSQGKEVTQVQKEYRPPLIWCAPSLFPELSRLFP